LLVSFKTWWGYEYPGGKLGYPFGDSFAQYTDHLGIAGEYQKSMFGSDNIKLYSYRINKGRAGRSGEAAHAGIPPGCVYQRSSINNQLQYMDEMMMTYKPKGPDNNGGRLMVFDSGLAHADNYLSVKTADAPLADFFKRVDARSSESDSAGMDNTFFFVLSDHGLHGTPLNQWWAGEYEHRNPVWRVLVPNKYLAKFPKVGEVLKANAAKLVSHRDTYCTLKALAVANVGALHKMLGTADASAEQPNRGVDGCYNVLTEVIPDRSCEDAGIPKEWCNCWEPLPAEKKGRRRLAAAATATMAAAAAAAAAAAIKKAAERKMAQTSTREEDEELRG
jgi:hypothetical protein